MSCPQQPERPTLGMRWTRMTQLDPHATQLKRRSHGARVERSILGIARRTEGRTGVNRSNSIDGAEAT